LETEDEEEFIPYSERGDIPFNFRSYVWLKQYNMFPEPGCWTDQRARFIRLVEWCDKVHSKWKAKQDEINAATAKLNAQLKGVM